VGELDEEELEEEELEGGELEAGLGWQLSRFFFFLMIP
jgi:hypothetical protein